MSYDEAAECTSELYRERGKGSEASADCFV